MSHSVWSIFFSTLSAAMKKWYSVQKQSRKKMLKTEAPLQFRFITIRRCPFACNRIHIHLLWTGLKKKYVKLIGFGQWEHIAHDPMPANSMFSSVSVFFSLRLWIIFSSRAPPTAQSLRIFLSAVPLAHNMICRLFNLWPRPHYMKHFHSTWPFLIGSMFFDIRRNERRYSSAEDELLYLRTRRM